MQVVRKRQRAVDVALSDDTLGDLVVVGVPARVFFDTHSYEFYESGKHLMEWPPPCTSLPSSSGGCTIGTAASDLYYGDDDEGKTGSEVGCVRTIDRYDARTLLDDTYLVMLSKGCLHSFHISKKEAEIEQLCDNERYADLYEAMKHENDEITEENPVPSIEPEVPHFVPFVPPFVVPDTITLPQTEKIHQIILRTALFTKTQGKSAVLSLTKTQATNPNFGFLFEGHPLHTYYVYLCETELVYKNPSQSYTSVPPPLQYAPSQSEDCKPNSTPPPHQLPLTNSTSTASSVTPNSCPDRQKSTCQQPPSPKSTEQIFTDELSMTGIVPPEPEVKKVVDKLVEFVLSNGTKFEVIVRERERSNPRFSFLLPWDTNNAYYNLRINFFRKRESNAGQDIISSDRVADNPEIAPTPSRPSIIVLPTGTTKPPLPNATRSIPCLKETPSPPEHTTNAPGSPEETHLGNTKLPAAPHTPSNPALFNNKLLPEHPEQPSPQLPAMQTSTPVPAPKSTDPVQLPPFPGHNLFPPILHTNKSTTTAAQASPPDTKRARLLRVKALLSSQLL